MRGHHRLGGTDRTLLWSTAALIAFTLGAVAYGRSNGGPRTVLEDTRLCVNAAEVYAACLPEGAGWPSPSPTAAPPPATVPSATVPPTGVPPAPTGAASPSALPPSSPPAAVRSATTRSTATASRPPAYPAWQVGVTYRVGDVVTYRDRRYACRQEHRAQSDWPPTDTPALWLAVG